MAGVGTNTVGGPFRQYAQNMAQIRFRIDTVQTAGACFPATSRNLSAEAGIRGKNALPGHESPGHWSSNQSRFSQHGTNIFGEKWLRELEAHNVLVTSAVNNNGVTELFALLHTEEGSVNFDWFSDENDDGDTQDQESMSDEGCQGNPD